MAVITVLAGGKILARGTDTEVVTSAGSVAFAVTINELRKVEYVLDIKFSYDPAGDTRLQYPRDIKKDGNVVGFTVYAETVQAGGTSITATADTIGYA